MSLENRAPILGGTALLDGAAISEMELVLLPDPGIVARRVKEIDCCEDSVIATWSSKFRET